MQRLITVLSILIFVFLHPTTTLQAKSSQCMVLKDGKEYRLKRAMPLAETITELGSANSKPHEFYLNSIFILLEEGERVLLSGTATGAGFVTDDIVTVETIPGDKTRSWDFRSRDHMTIIPVTAPQDITDLFLHGHSMITITMQDVLGPVYSSSAYWLLLFAPCTGAAATSTETPTLVPTATPVPPTSTATPLPPKPTATMTASAPVPMTATATVEQSAMNLVTPEVTITSLVEPAPRNEELVNLRPGWLQLAFLFWDWVLLGLVLLGAGFWQLLKNHPTTWSAPLAQWMTALSIAGQPVLHQVRTLWAAFKAYLERHTR